MAAYPLPGPFTVDTYHRLAELGILHEDDRVELIDGQVVAMTPIGVGHAGCVNRLTTLFAPLAGSRVTLSVQNPVILDDRHEPQPDFTVLRHRADGYGGRHPQAEDVLLVVEVSDTSAVYDRSVKVPRYALAGIPETWLVHLPADDIEVYRTPVGGSYTDVTTVSRGARLTPLALPGMELSVEEILG
jgi:Uma2 family endonuclease